MSYSFGILLVHAVETFQANSGHFNILKGGWVINLDNDSL